MAHCDLDWAGFAAGLGAGTIIIKAHRESTQLIIDVTDNGSGWPGPATDLGVGLSLTRERLTALYGAEGSIDLSGQPALGTKVRIRIPFHTMPVR